MSCTTADHDCLVTPQPAERPQVEVPGGEADDTVFSPGIVTPGHTISSLFRNIANTEGGAAATQTRKGKSTLGKGVPAGQEQTPEAAKTKGCWFKLSKVAKGK